MSEKTKGERTAWGVALWIWFAGGWIVGALVSQLAPSLPWWLWGVFVVGWFWVFLLLWDKGLSD